MFSGKKINNTEGRSVLHVALRMNEDESLIVPDSTEGDAVKNVHAVLKRIHGFSEKIRSEELKGFSGKALKNTLVIGIGGSYLGPEFVFEALKTDESSSKAASGRRLKFLANVDPIDFARAFSDDFDVEETLVVVNSKTFTTAETILNAKTVRNYLINHYTKKYPEEKDQ
jgi:glucose-6-phosphate isomerase